MNYDIPLGLYKVFCQVVDSGNMSIAAKDLQISQPSVSTSIRHLESRLGKPLLIRSSKGIKPTSEGLVMYRYLKESLDIIKIAEEKFSEMLNLESGEVRIAASDTITTQYLIPLIKDFFEKYSGINVKVINAATNQTMNLIENNEIDIGFINLPVDNTKNLKIIRSIDVTDCLIGGSNYSFLVHRGVELRELTEYPLILLEKDTNSRQLLDKFTESHNISLTPCIELGSNELIKEFCKVNLGLAIITRGFLHSEPYNDSIFDIPVTPAFPTRSIGMVKHKDRVLSKATDAFIENLL